jgi:hypothetical protein
MNKSLAMGVFLLAAVLSVSCSDSDVAPSEGRFVENGDGTVTDTETGLIWLENAACVDLPDTDVDGRANWWAANGLDETNETPAATGVRQLAHGTCGLTDNSSAGDWRLPTKEEWEAILDQANTNGCAPPYFPDISGGGCCGTNTCAFADVQSVGYWTATSDVDFPEGAWLVNLNGGYSLTGGKTVNLRVWPVRGGP